MKLLVLALAFLVAVSANHLINKRITNLVQEGYSVDNVVNLLVALTRVTGDNLQTLLDNWAQAESELVSNIENLESLTATQEQRCSEIDSTVNQLLDEQTKYRRYIRDAQHAIRTNLETLADRREKRCTSNLIFVQKLKDNQDGSRLLSYLRDRISDPSFQDYLLANGESLAELHHSVKHNKRSTLSLIAKHHMVSMIQQYVGEDNLGYDTEARSDIGHGHEDNDRGLIHLDSYTVDTRNIDNFVSELLGYVDDLVSQLSHERHALQASEFQAVEDLIDYQSSVDHQNIVLSTYIELWTVHLGDIAVTLEQDEAESSACHERADLLASQLAQAEDDYEEKRSAFRTTRRSLEGTLAALEEVINLYVRKVVNAPAVYLERIDEEIARAQPVDPEPVAPLTPEERAEVVEDFENEQRAEEAREEEAQHEAVQEEREEAALEREASYIEEVIEEREAERLEEAQYEAEPVIQELSATELADEEANLADQAAAAESYLEEIESDFDASVVASQESESESGLISVEVSEESEQSASVASRSVSAPSEESVDEDVYFETEGGNEYWMGGLETLSEEDYEEESEVSSVYVNEYSTVQSALSGAEEIVEDYESYVSAAASETVSEEESESVPAWESEETATAWVSEETVEEESVESVWVSAETVEEESSESVWVSAETVEEESESVYVSVEESSESVVYESEESVEEISVADYSNWEVSEDSTVESALEEVVSEQEEAESLEETVESVISEVDEIISEYSTVSVSEETIESENVEILSDFYASYGEEEEAELSFWETEATEESEGANPLSWLDSVEVESVETEENTNQEVISEFYESFGEEEEKELSGWHSASEESSEEGNPLSWLESVVEEESSETVVEESTQEVVLSDFYSAYGEEEEPELSFWDTEASEESESVEYFEVESSEEESESEPAWTWNASGEN